MGKILLFVISCLINSPISAWVNVTTITEGVTLQRSTVEVAGVNSQNKSDMDSPGVASSTIGALPKSVYLFFIYLIFIFGILGNSCVFILMQHESFRSSSYSVYLRFLAVADSCYLISTCTEDILDHQFGGLNDFLHSGDLVCKAWAFFLYFSDLISPWLAVAFAFDRYVAIIFPFRRKHLTNVRAAVLISCIIVFVIGGESVLYPVIYVYEDPAYNENCVFPSSNTLEMYYRIRLLLFESTLPCALILYLNIHVIYGVKKSSEFRQTVVDQQQRNVSAEKRITLSLVSISLMAFLTLTPMAIVLVLETLWQDEYDDLKDVIDNSQGSNATHSQLEDVNGHLKDIEQVWPILNLIKLLNFSQNFYVMMLTGRKYRQTFFAMLGMKAPGSSNYASSGNAGSQARRQNTESQVISTVHKRVVD